MNKIFRLHGLTGKNLIFFGTALFLFITIASLPTRAQTEAVPLFRLLVVEPKDANDLFSPTVKDRHFYTTDKAAKTSAVKNQKYEFEGIEGYLLPPDLTPEGTKRVRMLVRPGDGKYFYADLKSEADKAIGNLGYELVEIIGSVWIKKIEDTIPLYRLYRAGKRDDHFYTTNQKQKDEAVSKYGYTFEKIVGYVFANPTTLDKNGYPVGSNSSADIERKKIIDKVYKTAMGRAAQQSEIDYWLPRTENYEQIIAASRKWLYSADGQTDLRETITRAFIKKNGFKPSNEYMKNAVKSLSPKKQIYTEILEMTPKLSKIDDN